MVKKRFWVGMLVLVFGMTVVGCDNGSTGGGNSPTGGGNGPTGGGSGTDSALNGTWLRTSPDSGYECTLNNGNYEGRFNGNPSDKGTYTTNNGKMTMTITHQWGSPWNFGDGITLDAKWYTKSEFQSAYPSYPDLDNLFSETTWTYSISGNTLTRTLIDNSYTQTYTKK